MATKKQRRRREKGMRHEYEYVYVDDEGREIEVDEEEVATAKPERPAAKAASRNGKAKAAQRQPARGRAARKIEPPSWRRVGKRALIFAPLMFITISLLNGKAGFTGHAVQTLFLLAFFLPFSYVMDSIMYRSYVRRTGSDAPAKSSAK